MRFDHSAMTITQVVPYIFQGACPHLDSDFSEYGLGVHVYVMRVEVPAHEIRFRSCEWEHWPLNDNASAPATNPPTIIGMSAHEVEVVASHIAMRAHDKKPNVVLCQWGYNRSGLIVGRAMRKLGYSFNDTLRIMRGSRGPHPMGYGEALNNHNFRAVVERDAALIAPSGP